MEPNSTVSTYEMENIFFDCVVEKMPCLDMNVRDVEGRTLLHWATDYGFKKEVEYLLQWISPNETDSEGKSPLHLANYEIAELLLKHGADPNLRDRHGRTPLHYAAARDGSVVMLLLEAGADPNTQDENGDTPLHFARSKEAVEILIRRGADPNIKNKEGLPPIFSVAEHNCEAALVLYGVSSREILSLKDSDNETLLHIVARSGCKELAERLVDEKIDINAQNIHGDTALHVALVYHNLDVVKVLVSKGADVLRKNAYGMTPLKRMAIAVQEGRHYSDVISLVMDDANIEEILKYAFNIEQLRLLKLLLRRVDLENLQI